MVRGFQSLVLFPVLSSAKRLAAAALFLAGKQMSSVLPKTSAHKSEYLNVDNVMLAEQQPLWPQATVMG